MCRHITILTNNKQYITFIMHILYWLYISHETDVIAVIFADKNSSVIYIIYIYIYHKYSNKYYNL